MMSGGFYSFSDYKYFTQMSCHVVLKGGALKKEKKNRNDRDHKHYESIRSVHFIVYLLFVIIIITVTK